MICLYAKGYIRLVLTGVCIGVTIIIYALRKLSRPTYIEGMQLLPFWGLIIVIVFSVRCVQIVRKNKIEFGNGTVIIHRVSKDLKNEYWAPEGKWKVRENKVRLKNLMEYGYSFELIKSNLEFHHSRAGGLGIDMEVVFILKDDEKIPVELMYYTKKQIKELCTYIYNETGLKPSGKLQKYLNIK